MASPEPLLTVDDLARILRVTPRAVYNRRHKGALPPAIKIGSNLRWTRSAISKWLEQQTESAEAQEGDTQWQASNTSF